MVTAVGGFLLIRLQLSLSVDFEKCLKNAYLVAKVGFDTEESEPSKV